MRKPTQKKEDKKVTETSRTNKSPKTTNSRDETFNIQNVTFELKCKTENQKKFINLITDNIITICGGSPGTGKTFLACAQALKLMKRDERFNKIYLIKNNVELPGSEMGFVKGSVEDKMYNFLLSYMDNFIELIGEDLTSQLIDLGIIQVLPLAYLRGRSLTGSIIIIDESQNISLKNMRTILTRFSANTKLIIIGDSKQIDIKDKKSSSLETIIEMFSNKENIGTMRFEKSDIVRHPMIQMIEDEFDAWEEKQNQK